MYTDLRLKILRFFRKNSKIIFIVICIWVIIFIINMALKRYQPPVVLETTYEPHTSVMDNTDKVSKNVSEPIEEMIEEYVGYCNEGNVESAFEMLSDSCKEYCFDNNIDNFVDYLSTKMIGKMKYAIQDFSNEGNTYIYQIKYSQDLLATGVTNNNYLFTEEMMVFKKQRNGNIDMAVGNFIEFKEIKNISENEYLKVDVKQVIKYYSVEEYIVKFTNRTDDTIVIADGEQDNEVILVTNFGDTRSRMDIDDNIVLGPNESKTMVFDFQKYYDNDDDSKNITFGSVRVMEQYSGTNVSDETIQSEMQNAVAKFSVSIPVNN